MTNTTLFNRRQLLKLAGATAFSVTCVLSIPRRAGAAGLFGFLGVHDTYGGYPHHPIFGPPLYEGRDSVAHMDAYRSIGNKRLEPALDYDVGLGFPVTASAMGLAMRYAEGQIDIMHIDVSTTYLHFDVTYINGQKSVRRGEVIGTSGQKGGNAKLPHTHFEFVAASEDYGSNWPEKAGFAGGRIVVYDQVAEMDFVKDLSMMDELVKAKKDRLQKDFLDSQLERLLNKPVPKAYGWKDSPKDISQYADDLKKLTEDGPGMAAYLRKLVMKDELFAYGHPIYTLFLEVNAAADKRLTSLTHANSPSKPLTDMAASTK